VPQPGHLAPAVVDRASTRTTELADSTPTTATSGADGNSNSLNRDHDCVTAADCQPPRTRADDFQSIYEPGENT
jgi:hypothetical protein